MGRFKWLIVGVIMLSVFVVLAPWRATGFIFAGHTQSPAPRSHSSIPSWPWVTHGITYVGATFHTVPFPIKRVKDATVPMGQQVILTPGAEGLSYVRGSTTSVVRTPKTEVVAIGTAPVHKLVKSGVSYQYDRVISVMTTAYNASFAMNGPSGGVAAWDGRPLHPGDVAVDPRVIPLGTYLYIDGYGPARAVDTGSLIWGDHIDLFFNESAWKIGKYGIQFHKVYVLTGKPRGWKY